MLEAISTAVYGIPERRSFRVLRSRTGIADSTDIYIFDDRYIVHVSNTDFPETANNRAAKINAMRMRLASSPQCDVLPAVVAHGTVDQKSFVVFPRYRPLKNSYFGGKFDRFCVRKKVLNWTLQVAKLGQGTEAARRTFANALTELSSFPGMSREIRHAAIEADPTHARFVPMHGDLWVENVMRDGRALRFVDWGGSEPLGYGVYDLIRMAESFNMSASALNRELAKHAEVLGGANTLQLHLLGALGHFSQNLGQFPPADFLKLVERSWTQFCRCRPFREFGRITYF